MNENLKTKGEIKLTWCDIRSPEALALQKKIVKATGLRYRELLEELHKRFSIRSMVIENLCPLAGRNVLAMLLAGDVTYSGEINYCALGTTSTPTTAADTALGYEVYRKLVSSATHNSTGTPTAYFSTFFTAAETSGTYREVGHLIDGTAATPSGQLFSRISTPETAELPLTKSVTESLTVDYKVEIIV